jgi:serine/threonine protein kinase
MSGGSLFDLLLKKGSPLPESECLAVLEQMSSALQYIHAKQIVHGDVKPANILVDGNRYVLCDFNSSRYFKSKNVFTGTAGY